MSAAETESSWVERQVDADAGISLCSEWSLMAFTLLAAVLVAVVTTLAMAETRPPALAWIDAPLFAAAAAVSMGLASAHLGRKTRAWRAILNLRRSWLSREIACLSVFFGAATVWLAFLHVGCVEVDHLRERVRSEHGLLVIEGTRPFGEILGGGEDLPSQAAGEGRVRSR